MESHRYDIGPAPDQSRQRAIAFIAGGRIGGLPARQRAAALAALAESRGRDHVRIWWARRWRRCRAAAMTVANVGATAMVYFSSPDVSGVAAQAVPQVLSGLTGEALAGGLSLVQSLQDPRAEADIAALAEAGYHRLAELAYMELPLGDDLPAPTDAGLLWRHFGQFNSAELSAAITASYENSCDCPKLRGRRAIEDVITGHKKSGTFWPEGWQVAFEGSRPVACVLVNTSPAQHTADVVYLGVADGWRRRGIGRQLVRRAAREAYCAGWQTLTLAADVDNAAAMELYRAESFCCTHTRVAMVCFADAHETL